MDKTQILELVYQSIKRQYFPRWDRKGAWRVKDVWDLPSDGRCDTQKKIIYIRSDRVADNNDLRLLLIHEICHAFHPNHSEKWCQRINKAAITASRLGQSGLSDMLRREALEYYSDRMPTANEIYFVIHQAVQRYPEIQYGDLIRYLAFEQGLYKTEFEKKYSLCRKKYDQASNQKE